MNKKLHPTMHKKHRGVPAGRNLLIPQFVSRPTDGNALEIPYVSYAERWR